MVKFNKGKGLFDILQKVGFEWGFSFSLKDADKLYPYPEEGVQRCAGVKKPPIDTYDQ